MAATISATYGVSVCCIRILPCGNTVSAMFSCEQHAKRGRSEGAPGRTLQYVYPGSVNALMVSSIPMASFTNDILSPM